MEQIRIKVDTAVLSARTDAAEHRINEVKAGFHKVEEIVMNSRRYWEGEAGDAHRREYREYQNDIAQALLRFQENINDLRRIAGIYQETARETKKMNQDLPADLII